MKYLNKYVEETTSTTSNTSLANRDMTDGIFKMSDYNMFLVKESGLGTRSLSF